MLRRYYRELLRYPNVYSFIVVAGLSLQLHRRANGQKEPLPKRSNNKAISWWNKLRTIQALLPHYAILINHHQIRCTVQFRFSSHNLFVSTGIKATLTALLFLICPKWCTCISPWTSWPLTKLVFTIFIQSVNRRHHRSTSENAESHTHTHTQARDSAEEGAPACAKINYHHNLLGA